MKWIVYHLVLVILLGSGCAEKEEVTCAEKAEVADDTFQLDVTRRSAVSLESMSLRIDLFTEGGRTVSVKRGEDRHNQARARRSSSNVGGIPGAAQIILTAELKSEGGSSILEKECEIRTDFSRGGGSSSGIVDPNSPLSDLASFAVKSGRYGYGEEILLGTVEGDKWILTVK